VGGATDAVEPTTSAAHKLLLFQWMQFSNSLGVAAGCATDAIALTTTATYQSVLVEIFERSNM